MRRKLKRVGALALVIAMLLSMFAQGFAANGSQGGASTLSSTSPLADPATTPGGFDASADDTGKPRIYVDFLGDNHGHNNQGVGGAGLVDLGKLSIKPQSEHWYTDDAEAEPTKWSLYTNEGEYYQGEGNETIFYVGIGIDRVNLLKALESDNGADAGGVYSFEAGLYYNPTYAEPYVENGSYVDTIESINLSGGDYASAEENAVWDSSSYRIVKAVTAVDPQLDGGLTGDGSWGELTQEVIDDLPDNSYNPTNSDIRNPANGWKMTYVSIEMTAADLEARLKGDYGATGDEYESTTEYLLIIPFKLNHHDANERVCFRLIRNATHFSLGAMDGGNVNYAAWERVTTRNSDSNLKLQTTFTGDLNIFTGEKERDEEYRYNARLIVEYGGTRNNTVEVGITNDPSQYPVKLTDNGHVMTGLSGGTGLEIKTHTDNRYTVTVNVYDALDSTETPLITFRENGTTSMNADRLFDFIMPEKNVIIKVIFTLDPTAPLDFEVVLREVDRLGTNSMFDGSPIGRPDSTDPEIAGNLTTIEATLKANSSPTAPCPNDVTGTISSLSPATYPPNATVYPSVGATAVDDPAINPVIINTYLHEDYIAEVRLTTLDGTPFVPDSYPSYIIPQPETRADGTTGYYIVLEQSGEYRFDMRASDVFVDITYRLAPRQSASLEVIHHDADGNLSTMVDVLNHAQLSIVGYRDDNYGERRFSSVHEDVYQTAADTTDTSPGYSDPNEDKIVADAENILPVTTSASAATAAVSGDRAAKSIDELLKAAANCTPEDTATSTPADYTAITTAFNASDLIAMGLRKNDAGEYYTDAELATLLAPALLALTQHVYTNSLPEWTVDANYAQGGYVTLTASAYEIVQTWLLTSAFPTASGAVDHIFGENLVDHDSDPNTPDVPQGVAVRGGWSEMAEQKDGNIYARAGREVRVAVEASSEYIVEKVIVVDPSGANAPFAATKDPNYTNIYTFDMPAYNAEVEVYYAPRVSPRLTLSLSPTDAVASLGAEVTLDAYAARQGSLYPGIVTADDHDEVIEGALTGGVAKVTLGTVPDGYTATVHVTDSAGARVLTTPPSAANLTSGAEVTFVVPNKDATVYVTYIKDAEEQHFAFISVAGLTPTANIGTASALFDNGSWRMSGPQGTLLPGNVFVPVGYYIYAVTAVGASTSYSYTLSGNGWANGRDDGTGGVVVDLDSTMPNENIYITAYIAPGPPAEDPFYAVTLFSKDPDNVLGGTVTTYANNSSTMTVDAAADGTGGTPRDIVVGYPLGAGATEVASDTAYLNAGTRVYVDITVDAGYYVKSVTTSPAYLGVEVVWVSATRFYFTTPEKSVSVTVEFAKYDPENPDDVARQLTVDKTENGLYNPTGSDNTATSPDNTVTELKFNYLGTPTTKPDATETIDLNGTNDYRTQVDMRSEVTATVNVAEGWHVSAIRLIYNGYTHYLPLPADTYNDDGALPPFEVKFFMPTANAKLVVDYKNGAPKAGEHYLTLTVEDPDNVITAERPDYMDNFAKVSVYAISADTVYQTIGPLGLGTTGGRVLTDSTTANVGETVYVEWETVTGFALDLLVVTRTGGTIAPQYVYFPPVYGPDGVTVAEPAKTLAYFTMPNEDTTVLVRFKEGADRLYRADLVIYDPSGALVNAGNRASFSPLTSSSANDLYVLGDYVTTLHGGESVDVFIRAVDGYYIKSVTVTPYSTGVATTLTGRFGDQQAHFNMPAADVQVNVVFEEGWPNNGGGEPDARFDVLLTVIDPSVSGSYAHKLGGTRLVYGGETRVDIDDLADGRIEYIHLHTQSGHHVESVEVIDDDGNAVDWWWSGEYSNTIAFYMPPNTVEVIVTYAPSAPTPHTATLHIEKRGGANGTATLEAVELDFGEQPDGTVPSGAAIAITPSTPTRNTSTDGGSFNATAGEMLRITATPNNPGILAAIYAKTDSGEILELYSRKDGGDSLLTDGGAATFTMPDENVDVYVVFDEPLGPLDAIANLEVVGPLGSGSAELMRWNGDDPLDLTDTVGLTTTDIQEPASSDYIRLGMALTARVDITPKPGYAIERVTVVDIKGDPIAFDWILGADTAYDVDTDNDGIADAPKTPTPFAAITYKQPEGGSWVRVEFTKIDTTRDYNVRVVVNNAGEPKNTAHISMGSPENWVKLIDPAAVGDIVDVKIACEQGYRFVISVLPQSNNIHPTLTDLDNQSQQTSFLMPADDVIVYVRFESDTRDRYTATLSVVGGEAGDYAIIYSDFSPRAYATSGGASATAQALPPNEWVFVEIPADKVVDSITVETVSGVPVLYHMDAPNANGVTVLRFPMPAEDVDVIIRYSSDATPKQHNITLHVMATQDEIGNGTATITDRTSGNTVSVFGDYVEATGGITAAAGSIIDLSADLLQAAKDSTTGFYYIDKVYAEYADGPYTGQRIAISIDTATYDRAELIDIAAAQFVMQPYDIDVYVEYKMIGYEVEDPTGEHYVKLQLFGPDGAGNVTLTGGLTEITAASPLLPQPWPTSNSINTGTVSATAGTQMLMTLTVATDYRIDRIEVTPIGTDLNWVQLTNGRYVFEMPSEDVTIQIFLSKTTANNFIATLHYTEISRNGVVAADPSRAEIYYKDGAGDERYTDTIASTDFGKILNGVTLGNDQIIVPEQQVVDIRAYINSQGYYVLSAYVLTESGAMVRLTEDGIEGVEYDASIPKATPEGKTSFAMPPSNVDVYVVITNIDKPAEGWTTTTLVATDENPDTTIGNNSGQNIAEITERRVGAFLWETAYEPGLPATLTDLTASRTTAYTGYVKSYGNAGHKAYIVAANEGIYVDEGTTAFGYVYAPHMTTSASGAVAPSVGSPVYTSPSFRYTYTTLAYDTSAHMHYIASDTTAANLRVEIIDRENPSDNTVTNSVSVNAPNKPPLELESVTSAGAWHVINSVTPTDEITFVATPGADLIVIATLISTVDGEETLIALTKNATDGTYSGSFRMPSGGATLRVEFTYSSITLTLHDRSTKKDAVAQMFVRAEDEKQITLPVGSAPLYGSLGEVFGTSTASELSDGGVSELAAGSVDESVTRSIISEAAPGATTQTVSGIPNHTMTYTEVKLGEDETLVALIGENGKGTTLLRSMTTYNDFAGIPAGELKGNIFYTYGESEVTAIVEDYSATASRYPVVLELIDANDEESAAASVVNANQTGQVYGQTWTTAYVNDTITVKFTVDEGRTAKFVSDGGYSWPTEAENAFRAAYSSIDPNDNIRAGDYTFSFSASDIASTGGYELLIQFYSLPEISLAVIDTTGVAGNTASLSKGGSTLTDGSTQLSYTSVASVVQNGIIATTTSVDAGDTITVAAAGTTDTKVVRVYCETESGITEITLDSSGAADFDAPAGKSTVWVIYGNADGGVPDPDDPKNQLYTAQLVVGNTDSDWAAAGNSLTSLINVTDPTAAGGDLWKIASEGDEIRGTFTVAPGWYANVTVKDSNNIDVPFIRQTTNSELVIVEQPPADLIITVTFTQTPPETKSHTLYFSIIDHDGQAGNTATLTINGTYPPNTDNPKTLDGATAGTVDPYTEQFTAKVPFGTQLELEAAWADGYSVKKITVELRDGDDIVATYTVAGSEYDDIITAWMSMPDTDAYVCVYYGHRYTATLNYEPLNGGSGTAEMYDAADRANTTVRLDGEQIDNLSGGETIRTEPTANSGSRLVGVVYETAAGGARPTTTIGDDYDFTMPEADTDVYVVFEPANGSSYIAMVALAGESTVAGNDAVIQNITRTAVGTDHWQTAQVGDTLNITVTLAEGYQARITSAITTKDGGTVYVTRTLFRTSGLTSSFTMPLIEFPANSGTFTGSDVLVTVEFIEGYTAALILEDSSVYNNSAHMEGNSTTVTANSNMNVSGTDYTVYTKSDGTSENVLPGDQPTTKANKIEKLGVGDTLDGGVNVVSTDAKLVQLLYTTEFGGTFSIDTARLLRDPGETSTLPAGGVDDIDWLLRPITATDPVEDVTITAVIVDADENPLIAKVQLEGDSDINGNTAEILNTSNGSWLTGRIWTTAHATDTTANTIASNIETTVTLAPGYYATVIVINDRVYNAELDKLNADGVIDDADIAAAREEAKMQFTFNGDTTSLATINADSPKQISLTMPSGSHGTTPTIADMSDVTVIVTFNGDPGPRPYDPRNEEYNPNNAEEPILEKGWIYGTNHGDYATIIVPTLYTGETSTVGTDTFEVLDDVYRDSTRLNPKETYFRISVWVNGVFVELRMGDEINFYEAEELPAGATYPYNTGNYYIGEGDYVANVDNTKADNFSGNAGTNGTSYAYTGAKFNIELVEQPAGTTPSAAYQELAKILDNRGSYDDPLGTLLQIRAVDGQGRISEPTQLVIPPYYALEGTIVSYAPTHTATFKLFESDGAGGYKSDPHTVAELERSSGSGKWMQDFAVKSSDLGGRTAATVISHDLPVLFEGGTPYSSDKSNPPTYKLTIEKPATLTYTRTGIKLEIDTGVAVGGYRAIDGSTPNNTWILARTETVDTSAASEVSSMLFVESGDAASGGSTNDAYSNGNDTDSTYVVGEDTVTTKASASEGAAPSTNGSSEPVYGIDADTALVEGVVASTFSSSEETAPAAQADVTVRDMIMLVTGDVDPDRRTNQWDYNLIMAYIGGSRRWTRDVEGGAGWDYSTRNPESTAYLCDLNGDTHINYLDLDVLTTDYNYNKRVSFYGDPTGLERGGIVDYDKALVDYINEISASTDVSSFVAAMQQPSENAPVVPPIEPDAPDAADIEEPADGETSEETSTEEDPTEEDPTEEDPTEETPAEETPAEETPTEETPTEETDATLVNPGFFEEGAAPAPAALPPEEEEIL